jgi:hypothetical protein
MPLVDETVRTGGLGAPMCGIIRRRDERSSARMEQTNFEEIPKRVLTTGQGGCTFISS